MQITSLRQQLSEAQHVLEIRRVWVYLIVFFDEVTDSMMQTETDQRLQHIVADKEVTIVKLLDIIDALRLQLQRSHEHSAAQASQFDESKVCFKNFSYKFYVYHLFGAAWLDKSAFAFGRSVQNGRVHAWRHPGESWSGQPKVYAIDRGRHFVLVQFQATQSKFPEEKSIDEHVARVADQVWIVNGVHLVLWAYFNIQKTTVQTNDALLDIAEESNAPISLVRLPALQSDSYLKNHAWVSLIADEVWWL